MPLISDDDVLEQNYMAKLRSALTNKGVLVEYPVDRAAIDVGVHLWVDVEGKKEVTGPRVWFQAKGFHGTTVTKADYDAAETITTPSLELDHVRAWYNAPEPVYLALYVEAANVFLVVDVRDHVERNGGLAKIATQKTTTFKLSKKETLERALEQMPRHRSMRVDGPAWRGRPLGHGIDPLRSALSPMEPALFVEIVSELLSAHDFRSAEPAKKLSSDAPTVLQGRMHLIYEWVLPMTTEFGFDEGSEFRIEASPLHAQGDLIVVVDPTGMASPTSLGVDLAALAKSAEINRVIVMSNTQFEPKQFGQWFGGLGSEDPRCEPQDLASLTFNVLTTTNVFLEFHDRLAFSHISYL
ncbi:hypothetical protein C5E07_09840 [Pseudoclavibacter sp. RFBJ3]|uniref:DUF4365 domain-containing protein n=1 Tax=unclassified Pseudoclavibacter TaxID=2615177 RepID=UPI000CE7BDDE|nr:MULTISPECIES: DUF4365 domain-containing protein [unclassified Pseudoclavibacter]PPF83785.1 hypothetical protein C5C12_08920 [Pseudoclavibacter sp. RFBJ5]PPF92065.1 hypothetical protein C5E07_09840 [Pseudoclavibacter sp. RFBJ3]PPF96928.1 hypothetical protein C5C19_13150 [Pseudoclavibacter sp. RFBH5]PPG23615.1 hypothetical protein C5E13_08535 [Pseudoclavibacter sp. RFBI4]